MPDIPLCEICGYPLSLKLDGKWYCWHRHKKAIKNKRKRYSGATKRMCGKYEDW